MAVSGTPYEGRDNIVGPLVYTSALQLLLYTNTQDTLNASSVLADISEATGTGYVKVNMTGSWSWVNGIVTYDHGTPDDIIFENTGTLDWPTAVTGSAIIDGTYILHYKDLAIGSIILQPGFQLKIDISSLVSV